MKNTVSRIALAAAMAVGVVTGIAGIASPSFADVTVTVSIEKDKTITVAESISITKIVDLDVTIILTGLGAAEAQALANVTNVRNIAILEHVTYEAEIVGSISGNTGITQVNQAAGNFQNQGNIVSLAVTADDDAFVNSQAEVDQKYGGDNNNSPIKIKDSTFTASIGAGSLSGNAGVVQFNQDAGNNNNQTNAIAIAAGVDDPAVGDEVVAALSEAALGQSSTFQEVEEGGGTDPALGPQGTFEDSVSKSATISGALSGNTGAVMGINQAAGNNANQGNVVSVAAFVNF